MKLFSFDEQAQPKFFGFGNTRNAAKNNQIVCSIIGGSKVDKRLFGKSAEERNVHLNYISNLNYYMDDKGVVVYAEKDSTTSQTYIEHHEETLPIIRGLGHSGRKTDMMALQIMGVDCTSNHTGVDRCANKITTQLWVDRNDKIRCPKSLIIKQGVELQDIQELLEKHFKSLEYFILQLPYGSQGKTTFLIKDAREIYLMLQLRPLLIVKEFIDTKIDNKVSSVRLFFVDAEFVAGFKAFGFDHTSNVSKHHNAEPFMNPPQELIDMSEEVMKELKCYDIAGIDFIQSKENGKWFFLEANSNPGFGIVDITGVDVPGKIIDFSLRNKLSDKAKKLRDA